MQLRFLLVLFLLLLLSKSNFLDQQSLISTVNSKQKLWVSGKNQYFSSKNIQQIKLLMGSHQTSKQLQLPVKNIQPLKNIPNEFFSSAQWPNCTSINEIRDQSTCGSCWAFAAVQVLTDRICIASEQTKNPRISAQDLLTCCGNDCGKGCNGGYPPAAWTWFKNTGVVTGWLFNTTQYCQPYSLPPCDHHAGGKYPVCGNSSTTPNCSKNCVNGADYLTDKWFAKSIYGVGSLESKIQTQIMNHGPVQAMFTVYADFITYKSGVYHYVTGQQLGGHSVKIVGWGVENKIPYWLVANSWNDDWGMEGFFKIRRGNNECGIQGQVIAGIPKLKENLSVQLQQLNE